MKGGWVRYSIGMDEKGNSCYRLCEIVGEQARYVSALLRSSMQLPIFRPTKDVGQDLVQPYALDTARTDRQLELRHAELQRCWNMDRVSNSAFPQVILLV